VIVDKDRRRSAPLASITAREYAPAHLEQLAGASRRERARDNSLSSLSLGSSTSTHVWKREGGISCVVSVLCVSFFNLENIGEGTRDHASCVSVRSDWGSARTLSVRRRRWWRPQRPTGSRRSSSRASPTTPCLVRDAYPALPVSYHCIIRMRLSLLHHSRHTRTSRIPHMHACVQPHVTQPLRRGAEWKRAADAVLSWLRGALAVHA